MSKRTATQVESIEAETNQSFKRSATGSVRRPGNDEGIGDFEDAWDDEVSDGEVVDTAEGEEQPEDGMDIDVQQAAEDEDEAPGPSDVFLPNTRPLGKDEVLEPDNSVYEMLHRMNVAWPCLSFDVLRDGLGDERSRYPATAYLVTGTQADQAKNNELLVMKLGSMHRTQKDNDDSDDDSDDDETALDENASLEFRSIPHFGGINRIRAQPVTQLPASSQPYHVATWADTGKVHIYNVRPTIESLDVPGFTYDKDKANAPIYTVTNHGRTEGFAMDWASSGSSGGLRLLTGDIASKIYLTTTSASGFTTSANPFTSHTSSVEDLQWSPTEPTVFASCSADQSIRIWDVRVKGRKSVVNVERAHDSDVNVISWNKGSSTGYLLVSGGDEGGIKVWDLRNFKGASSEPSPVASFAWHKAPITSIEWHPSEDSTFAASGADDQVTLWDLAVEDDEEETGTSVDPAVKDVPPQLLFVHQGQRDIKEIHWHPQIPGAVLTTALDGFNLPVLPSQMSWTKGSPLGTGAMGTVYMGLSTRDGSLMAVREIPPVPSQPRSQQELEALEREVTFMRQFNRDGGTLPRFEYDSVDDIVRICYRYCAGGSIASLLRHYGPFEEKLAREFIRQVLEILDQLHEQHCYPSNLSTANIFVLNDGQVELSDFGISPHTKSFFRLDGLQDSCTWWRAPERGPATPQSNVWEIGTIVVEMLSLSAERPPSFEIPVDISASATEFIKMCTSGLEQRPSVATLLYHAWITGRSSDPDEAGSVIARDMPSVQWGEAV